MYKNGTWLRCSKREHKLQHLRKDTGLPKTLVSLPMDDGFNLYIQARASSYFSAESKQ